MYIVKETYTPTGGIAMVHRVQRVEIVADTITVTINSYASETAQLIMWQDSHIMPAAELNAMTYPESVYSWLVSPIGPFPGGQLLASPTELEVQQAKMMTEITSLRDKKISSGCETPLGRVDTDEISIRNIMGTYQSAVLSMIAQQPFSVNWRMADNTSVAMDGNQIISVGNAVLQKIKDCYERSWVLKEEVSTATEETIGAIVITEGWPE